MVLVEEVPILPDTDMIDEIEQTKVQEDRLVRSEIKRAQSIAARHQVQIKCHVFTGHVVRTVVDFANDNAFDLVVIGATKRGSVRTHAGHARRPNRQLGSVSGAYRKVTQCGRAPGVDHQFCVDVRPSLRRCHSGLARGRSCLLRRRHPNSGLSEGPLRVVSRHRLQGENRTFR